MPETTYHLHIVNCQLTVVKFLDTSPTSQDEAPSCHGGVEVDRKEVPALVLSRGRGTRGTRMNTDKL
jgi:hypothetical protein